VRRESVSSSSPSSSDSSLLIASYCSFGFCVGIFELGVLAASVLDQFSARSVVFGRLDISFGRLFVAGPFVSMLHGAVFLCLFLDLLWTLWVFVSLSSARSTVWVVTSFPFCTCIPFSSLFSALLLDTLVVRVMAAGVLIFMCGVYLGLVAVWSVILMSLCWWCLVTMLGG